MRSPEGWIDPSLHYCGRDCCLCFVFVEFLCYLLSVLHKERKATFLHRDTLDLLLLDFAWRPGVMSERERGRPVYFDPSESELEGKGKGESCGAFCLAQGNPTTFEDEILVHGWLLLEFFFNLFLCLQSAFSLSSEVFLGISVHKVMVAKTKVNLLACFSFWCDCGWRRIVPKHRVGS